MDKNEKLVASVFDNAITALGLMTNNLSDSIKAPMSDEQVRDHFAGLAMQGILSSSTEMRSIGGQYTSGEYDHFPVKNLANESYLIADAMLKARKEVKP